MNKKKDLVTMVSNEREHVYMIWSWNEKYILTSIPSGDERKDSYHGDPRCVDTKVLALHAKRA